jgi:hypothetical protein
MHGKMSRLEVHHIFPKAQLYKAGCGKAEVNAVANFCFQTKDTNLQISDRLPEQYCPEIEEKHPGALASQWIPMERELWRLKNYPDFLAARRELLARATNAFLIELAHDPALLEAETISEAAVVAQVEELVPRPELPAAVPGAIESAEEEAILRELNEWVQQQGLPEGQISYELDDPMTGQLLAILDLAWPDGLQPGLSQPVTMLIGEGPPTFEVVNRARFRYFTDVEAFKKYVREEVLATANATTAGPGLWSAGSITGVV